MALDASQEALHGRNVTSLRCTGREPQHLAAGSYDGLLLSNDGGQSWQIAGRRPIREFAGPSSPVQRKKSTMWRFHQRIPPSSTPRRTADCSRARMEAAPGRKTLPKTSIPPCTNWHFTPQIPARCSRRPRKHLDLADRAMSGLDESRNKMHRSPTTFRSQLRASICLLRRGGASSNPLTVAASGTPSQSAPVGGPTGSVSAWPVSGGICPVRRKQPSLALH
jgi:hypothetical protein